MSHPARFLVHASQVNLSRNGLGEDCGSVVADALGASRSLTSFDLGFNSIGRACALHLLRALPQRAGLLLAPVAAIGLAECGLGPEDARTVAEILLRCPSLTWADLRANALAGPEERARIEGALGESGRSGAVLLL